MAMLKTQPQLGAVTWRSYILVGIGDDDTAGDCVAEDEFDSQLAARAWVERELPVAQLPDWVFNRQHGAAGAFLFGSISRGTYTFQSGAEVDWEPDVDDPVDFDADLIDGVVRWVRS